MEARLKNFVTIRDSHSHQGLSNHITFRPIKSGAMVPLMFYIKITFSPKTAQSEKGQTKLLIKITFHLILNSHSV